MSGAALAPVLEARYGNDRNAYHLTADYTWGWTQQESIQAATEAKGWNTVNNVLTPLATTDFSSYVAPVLNSGADVLVLNHYGGNMINSLTSAVTKLCSFSQGGAKINAFLRVTAQRRASVR